MARLTINDLVKLPPLSNQKEWCLCSFLECLTEPMVLPDSSRFLNTMFSTDENLVFDVLAHDSNRHDDSYAETLIRLTFKGEVIALFLASGRWNDEVKLTVISLEGFKAFKSYLIENYVNPFEFNLLDLSDDAISFVSKRLLDKIAK